MISLFFQNLPRCLDAVPNVLGLFDTTVAPSIIFYSYIPILVVSLLFGLIIYRNNRKSLVSKLFLGLTAAFSAWIGLILIQWMAIHASIVHFAWQALITFEFLIYVLGIFLSYILIYRKDPPVWLKNTFLLLVSATAVIMPTALNVSQFDLTNCEGVIGSIWNIEYAFEIAAIVLILSFIIDGKRKKKYSILSTEISVSLGTAIFLTVFFFSNFLGEITKTYDINLIGPLGMVVLLLLLSYAILKHQAFQVKLFVTQILISAQLIFIFSLLFVGQVLYNNIIVLITLTISLPLGFYIIKSVKREVEQRERIQALALDLKAANDKLKELDQMKSEFLSLATHQIRSPLTSIKGYASLLLDGDYGTLDEKAKEGVKIIFNSTDNLVKIVGDFLNISRIEQGRMAYNKEIFDIATLARETANEYKPNIDKAKLNLTLDISDTVLKVNADKVKTKEIMGNLIDNAIKYTLKGGIDVRVWEEAGQGLPAGRQVKISVKDTGIGIDPSEIGKLFNKFSRTKDAHKTSVTGTGLGLYIAKQMAVAQGGDIEVHSEGEGKGATFTFRLPRVD